MSVARLIPKRIRDQQDANMSPGAGTNGYAIVYNHTSGKFELGTFDAAGAASAAVAAHVALSDPHAQYALESALGTAAAYNVGTGANNIVQLDGSAKLPAVDGSQLTNLPGGAVAGSNTQVIINDGGAYAGDPGLTYAKATDRLTVAGGIVAGDWSPPSDSITAVSIWNAARSERIVTVDTSTPAVIVHPLSSASTVDSAKLHLRMRSGGTEYAGKIYYGSAPSAADFIFLNYANTEIFRIKETGAITVPAVTMSGILSNQNPELKIQRFNTSSYNTIGFYDTPGGARKYHIEHDPSGKFTITRDATGNDIVIDTNSYIGFGTASPTAAADFPASTTARASLRIRTGVAPTSPAPNVGDMYQDGTHAYMYLAGAWKQLDN